MLPSSANVFESDLRLIQEAIRSRVTNEYAKKKDTYSELWNTFCVSQSLSPFLRGTKDPVPYLQVFGVRYCDGRIPPRGKPVAAGTVKEV